MKTRLIIEFLGTAILAIAISASGIWGRMSDGQNAGLVLTMTSLSIGFIYYILIKIFGSRYGAHFNPVISLLLTFWHRHDKSLLVYLWTAQFSGAVTGAFLVNSLFTPEALQISSIDRFEISLLISEFVATFGLMSTIILAAKGKLELAPVSIAAYLVAAQWFTPSNSFINPALTFSRIFTDTLNGISPLSVIPFMAIQVFAGIVSLAILRNVKLQNISDKEIFANAVLFF